MSSPSTGVVIVGGGLSGLYAAWLLQQHGHRDWVLIEARATLGGRILSAPLEAHAAGRQAEATTLQGHVDLGPSWFWPACQPQLDHLIRALGIGCHGQHEAGDMLVERSPHTPPVRTPGFASAPPSMRLAGGMGSLVKALRDGLDAVRIATGMAARRLRHTEAGLEVHCEDTRGHSCGWQAQQVLLALPPRLAASSIEWDPPLPPALERQWRATDTWMAPHAKYVAVYDDPFWHALGLSGAARSACGPLAEIHDATVPGGSAALFGFIGVPARTRLGMEEDALRAHCRAQLARLFGPQAAAPRAELLKDWASDPFTATSADWDSVGQHPEPPPAAAQSGPWAGRLVGIGSEWSRQFPGYVAGAIEAASIGVGSLARRA